MSGPSSQTLVSVHLVPHSRESGITVLEVLMSKDSANNCGELADQAEKKLLKQSQNGFLPIYTTNQWFSVTMLFRYINKDIKYKEIVPSTKTFK